MSKPEGSLCGVSLLEAHSFGEVLWTQNSADGLILAGVLNGCWTMSEVYQEEASGQGTPPRHLEAPQVCPHSYRAIK